MLQIVLFIALLFPITEAYSQQNVIVNLSPLDGVAITPDNIFNFQVQNTSSKSTNARVRGTIHYRNNNSLHFEYTFVCELKPGLNIFNRDIVHPQWTYSNSGLQDLFSIYKRLPVGTYEYCVDVAINYTSGELSPLNSFDECLYQRSDDIFLFNLTEPDNNAKIHEYNPLLSWVANYPFASELTYRIRVAELKNGQNPSNALTRNNPVYDEKNLFQTSITYPIYAKPLQKYQPYAWTVDAYYKGVLLGGAEPWKFTIIEDTLLNGLPRNTSFVDIKKETGKTVLYAIGNIKMKYNLDDARLGKIFLSLTDENKKEIKLKETELTAVYGDNRYVVDFKDKYALKHMTSYTLTITTEAGVQYPILFKYVNPDFLK